MCRRRRCWQESLIATGFPSQKRHASPNVHFYQEFTLRSHGVRRAGSAALDMAYVACGRLEAFWEFQLNPWDTSAGYLLVEEAGGTVTHFDGSKFTLDSREVLATNGLIHGGDAAPVRGHVCGPQPGADSYAGGVRRAAGGERAWPLRAACGARRGSFSSIPLATCC